MTPPVSDFTNALVFTGGGTGGHYFPAVALAEAAREHWPGRPIAFVGACRGIEARLLPESPWPHVLLDVEGFLGRSPLKVLKSAWKLWQARRELVRRWRKERPSAVVGTGGYGAGPALFAARALKIPYFLHESNAEPGLLVTLLSGRARRVWCGMAPAVARLPEARAREVGTPVRQAFRRAFRPLGEHTAPHGLLVLGGSGGARALNEAMLALAPALLDRHSQWELVHQVGHAEWERLRNFPRHPRHKVVPFIPAPDQAMEAASLLVSRSGASTCAELKACGRPAILVPFPQSAGDHQRQNARALQAEGRARMVEQGEGFPFRLEAALDDLMGDSAACQALARPEANQAVSLCLEDLEEVLGG